MLVPSLTVIFGILGNVVSFVVFLAPVPTFYRIYKSRSSDGYHSIPYAVALFSATILLYYGSLKANGTLLFTINSFGCVVEVVYLAIYTVCASKELRISTMKLLLLFNLGAGSGVILFTSLLAKGAQRVAIVGWINAVINICVFVSPLSIMGKVIRTKSVEYMPILLSFALTVNATMWFFYGFFIKDYYIAAPNILGFILGLAQMILYIIYKKSKNENESEKIANQQEGSKDFKLNLSDNTFHSNQQIEMKTEQV